MTIKFQSLPTQLEISDEKSGAEVSKSGQATDASHKATASLAEELDNLMDISIEIASNKRMKRDYIKPFKLTFKDKEMEKKVHDADYVLRCISTQLLCCHFSIFTKKITLSNQACFVWWEPGFSSLPVRLSKLECIKSGKSLNSHCSPNIYRTVLSGVYYWTKTNIAPATSP